MPTAIDRAPLGSATPPAAPPPSRRAMSSSATFEIRHRLIAAGRILAQAAKNGLFQVEAAPDACRCVGGVGSSLRICASVERRESPPKASAAGDHLVEHRAEAEDVGAAVDWGGPRPAPATCRPAVPTRGAGLGERRRPRRRRTRRAGSTQLGDAEVEHLDAAGVGDHDVGGLQIAMDDAGAVRRRPARRRLRRRTPAPASRCSPSVGITSIERRAGDVLHHDEVGPPSEPMS